MHRILVSWGPLTVYSYGLLMVLGILAGTALAYWRARRRNYHAEAIWDLVLYVTVAGLLGARLWEVVFSWSYYGQHPGEILAIWRGGLSVQGSILGAAPVVYWYTRKHGIDFWRLADIMVPGVLLGQAIGRLGCFLNGCCFGVPTGGPLGVVFPPGTDAYAALGAQPLVPTQLLEAGYDLLAMGLLLLVDRRPTFPGFLTTLYFILYALGRFGLEFWRADSLLLSGGLKTAQVTSLLTAAVALGVMFYLRRRNSKL